MNASEFPPGGVKLLGGSCRVFAFRLVAETCSLGSVEKWRSFLLSRENIKIKVAACPIGYAGNMYKLPKQNMFNVLVTGRDKLPKIIVLGTYRFWVLKGGPK